jgi:2-oxoglutarate ferredoxin oxidoreductase subunit delta
VIHNTCSGVKRRTNLKKLVIYKNRCKACGFCIDQCPKDALSLGDEYNASGYAAVTVDEDECIRCGTCSRVCPDSVFELIEE